MTKGWTDERRKKQAERIRQTQPWKKSTGPKTPKGKARASLNAFKHGARCRHMDHYRYMLWLNRAFVQQVRLASKGDMDILERTTELKTTLEKRCKNKWLEN